MVCRSLARTLGVGDMTNRADYYGYDDRPLLALGLMLYVAWVLICAVTIDGLLTFACIAALGFIGIPIGMLATVLVDLGLQRLLGERAQDTGVAKKRIGFYYLAVCLLLLVGVVRYFFGSDEIGALNEKRHHLAYTYVLMQRSEDKSVKAYRLPAEVQVYNPLFGSRHYAPLRCFWPNGGYSDFTEDDDLTMKPANQTQWLSDRRGETWTVTVIGGKVPEEEEGTLRSKSYGKLIPGDVLWPSSERDDE